MTQDYLALLEQLRTKKRAELLIKSAEFMQFQPYLMNYSHKKNIVGQAMRGGDILYHYADESKL